MNNLVIIQPRDGMTSPNARMLHRITENRDVAMTTNDCENIGRILNANTVRIEIMNQTMDVNAEVFGSNMDEMEHSHDFLVCSMATYKLYNLLKGTDAEKLLIELESLSIYMQQEGYSFIQKTPSGDEIWSNIYGSAPCVYNPKTMNWVSINDREVQAISEIGLARLLRRSPRL